MADAPRKVEAALADSARQRDFGPGEQGLQSRNPFRNVGGGRAAADRRPQPSHVALDLGDKAGIAGAEQRFHRLESVEIGGQRQFGRLIALTALVSVQAAAKQLNAR
jgi:hypothetical protein